MIGVSKLMIDVNKGRSVSSTLDETRESGRAVASYDDLVSLAFASGGSEDNLRDGSIGVSHSGAHKRRTNDYPHTCENASARCGDIRARRGRTLSGHIRSRR